MVYNAVLLGICRMAFWTNYHTPATINEALELLQKYKGSARIVGGGTDLLLEIQQGHRPPVEALVDPSRITGLDTIDDQDGFIVIGAGVCHSRLVSDLRIRRHGTCLAESCGVIGGPQVRNVGTLAGNVAHALPAGDGTLGLLALDGEVEIACADGTRWVSMSETFLGPGKSTVDPTNQLITRLRFKPTAQHEGSAYRRVMRPQGVALPMLATAARIGLDGNTISSVRVTIGPAGPVPFLAEKTMQALSGQEVSNELFRDAASIAAQEASFRDSRHRASAAYRKSVVVSELEKTLHKAAARAAADQPAEPEGIGE